MKRLLLIIDPQNDFITGSLPVPGAEEAMQRLATYLHECPKDYYTHIVVSVDYHPWNHVSFSIWPPHCLQYTEGAAIQKDVYDAVFNLNPNTQVCQKGYTIDRDAYSVFDWTELKTELIPILNLCDQVDVCGLAGDVCVKATIQSLCDMGYGPKTKVLFPFIASLDDGSALAEVEKLTHVQTANA